MLSICVQKRKYFLLYIWDGSEEEKVTLVITSFFTTQIGCCILALMLFLPTLQEFYFLTFFRKHLLTHFLFLPSLLVLSQPDFIKISLLKLIFTRLVKPLSHCLFCFIVKCLASIRVLDSIVFVHFPSLISVSASFLSFPQPANCHDRPQDHSLHKEELRGPRAAL